MTFQPIGRRARGPLLLQDVLDDVIDDLAEDAPQTWATPGHCVSIDGEWWHEPGTCPGPPNNCTCCGPREGGKEKA